MLSVCVVRDEPSSVLPSRGGLLRFSRNNAPELPKRSIKLLARNLLALNDPELNEIVSQIYYKKFNRPLDISDTEPTLLLTPPETDKEEANRINDEPTNAPETITSLQKYIAQLEERNKFLLAENTKIAHELLPQMTIKILVQ